MIDWFMDDLTEAAHGLYWPVVEIPPGRWNDPTWLTWGLAAVLAGGSALFSRYLFAKAEEGK